MSTAWKLANDDRKRIQGVRPVTDYQQIVRTMPGKAGQVFAQLRAKINDVEGNHLVPDSGKQIERLRLINDARTELEQLGRQLETAAVVAEKKAQGIRDGKRPKTDVHEQAVYQSRFERMVDAGVDLYDVIESVADDPKGLRALESEIGYLARAAQPHNSDAATMFQAALLDKTLNAYGDDYRQAHEQIDVIRKQADMARFALAEAKSAATSGTKDDVKLPDHDGSVITV